MTIVSAILLITTGVPLFIAIAFGAALASRLRTPLDETVYRSLTGRVPSRSGRDLEPCGWRPLDVAAAWSHRASQDDVEPSRQAAPDAGGHPYVASYP